MSGEPARFRRRDADGDRLIGGTGSVGRAARRRFADGRVTDDRDGGHLEWFSRLTVTWEAGRPPNQTPASFTLTPPGSTPPQPGVTRQ